MFHRATDASKVALWAMINKVRELGFQLFDAQMTNPHLVRLGCFEIPYLEYLERMSVALATTTEWSLNYDGIEAVQRVIKSLEEKKT
jgi:leucyl/phenylalanyl-tRNA--protein transferase